MKGKTSRFIAVAIIVLALTLVMAASAFATTHTTQFVGVGSASLTATFTSVGDDGLAHGNFNNGTSPILPDPGPDFFQWFNQPVAISDLHITDDVDADDDITTMGGFWQVSHDGTTWGAPTNFLAADQPIMLGGEGIYSITATGTDLDDPADTTGTIQPAFGIDKTDPVSTTDLPAVPAGDPDAIPVFNSTAVVNIMASDALSGVENLTYTMASNGVVDPNHFAFDAEPGAVSVPVTFDTAGFKTLMWTVFDNAGNHQTKTVMFIVRPTDFVPTVGLVIRQSGTGGHTLRVSGELAPISSAAPVVLTIQRWNGTSGVPFTSFSRTVPMFWDDFAATKSLPRHRRFRVRAMFAGGVSPWRYFRTR